MLPVSLMSSFLTFVLDYFPYIIVGLMILVFAVIVTVAVRRRKKPRQYVSDDIDRTVDALAEEKAAQRKAIGEQDNQELPSEDQPKQKDTATEHKDIKPKQENSTEHKDIKPKQKDSATEGKNSQPKQENSTEHKNSQPEQENSATEGKDSQPKQENSTEHKDSQPKQENSTEGKNNQPKQENSATEHKDIKPKQEKNDSAPTAEDCKAEADQEEPLETDTKADGKPERKKAVSYRILYDKETKTWEVRKDNAKRVIRRVKTKKEALEIAQELSQKQDLNLVVHKKDGKFQKKR